jgi:hypothetical protein
MLNAVHVGHSHPERLQLLWPLRSAFIGPATNDASRNGAFDFEKVFWLFVTIKAAPSPIGWHVVDTLGGQVEKVGHDLTSTYFGDWGAVG